MYILPMKKGTVEIQCVVFFVLFFTLLQIFFFLHQFKGKRSITGPAEPGALARLPYALVVIKERF